MPTLYLKRLLLTGFFGLLTVSFLFSARIVVTSTADAGEGSLRAAIAAADFQ